MCSAKWIPMAVPIAANSGRRWRESRKANWKADIINTQAAGECGKRRGSEKAGSGIVERACVV